MLFHQMQLMVCAVIAKRWAATGPDGSGDRPVAGTPAHQGDTSPARPMPA